MVSLIFTKYEHSTSESKLEPVFWKWRGDNSPFSSSRDMTIQNLDFTHQTTHVTLFAVVFRCNIICNKLCFVMFPVL